MKIVVDKDIPFAEEYFSVLGEVEKVDGRLISPDVVKDATILVIRTVTAVDAQLLSESRIKFVASATSGIDHVDLGYLNNKGIGFGSAPGSNARSVAEYVLSCLFVLRDQNNLDIAGKTAAVIGHGHVGSIVADFFRLLGLKCLINDPPLAAGNPGFGYCNLEDTLAADIITLHVPLKRTGDFSTWHMLGDKFLTGMKEDAVLINTSRGDVIDESALLARLGNNRNLKVVLDVWSSEPDLNIELLSRVDVGTPHIAGYSMDGKLQATQIVFKHACEFFNIEYDPAVLKTFFDEDIASISISEELDDMDVIQMAVLASYDVRTDSSSLRQIQEIDQEQRQQYFYELRKNYRTRREFEMLNINLLPGADELSAKLTGLGFRVTGGRHDG